MEGKEIKLIQERAGNIRVNDWLPNLGKVSRVLTNGEKVRFYFQCSASREFDIAEIVYRDFGNDARHRRWIPENANPSPRQRPLAVRGVSIE